MRDYSIDTETLSLRHDAPIISIGVQQFDRDTGKMGKSFYRAINLDSAIKVGRVMASTLEWWMKQSEEARKVFSDPDRFTLATALDEMCTFIRSQGGVPRVYARGPAEDIAWIRHSLDVGTVGLGEPWHYQNVFDLRTLIDIMRIDEHSFKPVGTKHNALDDAKWQAMVIASAYMKANKLLGSKPAPVEEEL